MKVYKKSKLTIENGLVLTKKGKVITLNPAVVKLANQLDLDLQKAMYLKAQPKATPAPSLKGFKPKSERMWDDAQLIVETPLHDAELAHSIELMEELDNMTNAVELENRISDYQDLLEFASSHSVLSYDSNPIYINTPELGNILELSAEEILEAITIAYIDCDEVEAIHKNVQSE